MTLEEVAKRVPAAGLMAGAFAWGVNTELNYALVPRVCVSHWPAVPLVTLIAALVGLAGVAISIIAWREDRPLPSADAPTAGVPHKLLAGIGAFSGALFTIVIVLQGLASLFLSGCE